MNMQILGLTMLDNQRYRLLWFFFAAFLCGLPAPTSVAQASKPLENELWLVSTRDASSTMPSDGEACRVKFWKCTEGSGWQQEGQGRFFDHVNSDVAGEPVPLCIYVHENRVSADEAFSRAKPIWEQLQRTSTLLNGRFRFVVISWPSDRIGIRPRPDARIKAQRSEMHGYYLAWLLDQIDPQVPVSMFGYSYGPRLMTAALHLLGGGTIAGHRLVKQNHAVRPAVRVALFAPAMDSDWLLPMHQHGRAISQVEHMLVAFNPCDPVLRWYPRLYGRGGPPALGYAGMPASRLGPDLAKVELVNVSCSVGETHNWQAYEGSSDMMLRLAPYLLRKSDHFR